MNLDTAESLLLKPDSKESMLVTLHRAIHARSAYIPITFREQSAHVLLVAVAAAVRRGAGGRGRL